MWKANGKVHFLIKMKDQPSLYDERFARYRILGILAKFHRKIELSTLMGVI